MLFSWTSGPFITERISFRERGSNFHLFSTKYFIPATIIYGSGLIFYILFQVQSFIQQILEGVGHIHSMNILHLDIKVRSSQRCIIDCVIIFDAVLNSVFIYTPFSLIIF